MPIGLLLKPSSLKILGTVTGQIRADVYKEERKYCTSQGLFLWQFFVLLLCNQQNAHLQLIHLTDECNWHYGPKALIMESLVI